MIPAIEIQMVESVENIEIPMPIGCCDIYHKINEFDPNLTVLIPIGTNTVQKSLTGDSAIHLRRGKNECSDQIIVGISIVRFKKDFEKIFEESKKECVITPHNGSPNESVKPSDLLLLEDHTKHSGGAE